MDDLLSAAPSRPAWNRICEALDALEGRELDAAIAKVNDALEAWKPFLRFAPRNWAQAAATTGSEPRLRAARTLNLTGQRGLKTTVDKIAECPDIADLHSLIFSLVPIAPKKMKLLAASPHLERIALLRFSMCFMKDTGLSHLSKSESIQGLRTLDLGNNDLGPRGGKIVAKAKTQVFTGLESLSYANNKIGTEGALFLAQAELAALRALDLSRNEVGVEGLRAIATSKTLSALSELTLSDFGIAPELLDALDGTPLLERLHGLKWTGDSDEPTTLLPRLFGLAGFTQLRRLQVSYQGLTDEDLIALAGQEGLGLERLQIDNAHFTKKGVEALAKSPVLAEVKELQLGDCKLDDDAACALIASPHLTKLERLELHGDGGVADRAAEAVAKSAFAGQLESLSFYETSVGDAGAKAIAKLPKLASLSLPQTKVGDAGAIALAEGGQPLTYLGLPDELGKKAQQALKKGLGEEARSALRL